MRTHRIFEALQPWRNPELQRDLARTEHLVALRVEPVMRWREPSVLLDLHFDDGARHLAIPFVVLDVAKCADGIGDPLVFPAAAAAIDDRAAAALIERVLEVLLPAAVRGDLRREELMVLGDARRVEAARDRGWFAAAPLERTIPPIAPAVYARRFAARRTAFTYGPDAPALAAFLGGAAQMVAFADGEAEAAAWFGVAPSEAERVDLAVGAGPAPVSAATVVRTDGDAGVVVAVVRPLATDVLLSFDPADGPVAGRFTIEGAPEPALRAVDFPAPAIVGRSAGRVALVVRGGAERRPDADVDEACALAAGLTAEGFDVRVIDDVDALSAFEPDLVHLVGLVPGGWAESAARWAEERNVPLAVHAYEAAPYAYWGSVAAAHCFTYAGDERTTGGYLHLLAQRRIEVDGIAADGGYTPPDIERQRAESVLRKAALVFVSSETEAEAVRRLQPRGGICVVPVAVPRPASPAPVGALVGDAPFALVLAPLRRESNALVMLKAAAAAQIRLVLAGATEDVPFAEVVRASAGDHALLLPEPSPAVRSALLAAARIFVDGAWVGRGSARIEAAVLAGAVPAVALSRALPFDLPPGLRFDPANVGDAARAMGDAWDTAQRRDPRMEQLRAQVRERGRRSIATVLEAYAKLASPSGQPVGAP